ncbi:MAG: CBS domain-containing protein [Candidatus Omnitrophica bacterium]|nr:CBS domain-containing protein [Candidatus Omnitrophota bacterium]
MQIRELMTSNPAACVPTDSCATALELMGRRACGFLPVVDTQAIKRVVGVVTDRDIALRLGQMDLPASQVTVASCMTSNPKTTTPETELEEAAKVMEGAAVHRLPVIADGRLVGILSLKDIALAARKQWAYSGPHVAERQMTEIIEAIAAAQLPRKA